MNKQGARQTVRDSSGDSGVGNADRRGYPSHHDRYTVVSPAMCVHLAPQYPGLRERIAADGGSCLTELLASAQVLVAEAATSIVTQSQAATLFLQTTWL